jgi:hypothetical protein
VKVKCIKEFYDKVDNVRRSIGDEFEATQKRVAQIQKFEDKTKTKYIEIVDDKKSTKKVAGAK